MAEKRTYLYKIMMGNNGSYERTEYCYARNSSIALYEYQQKFKDKKYDSFKAVMFGEADFRRHPLPFEEMPEDEVNAILANSIAKSDAFRQIVDKNRIGEKKEELTDEAK